MCFSANLKKCLSGLMLAGVALWFAGCSESASTPTTRPSGSTSTPPKVNSDGSTKSAGDMDEGTAGKGTGSSSDGKAKTAADDDDEQNSSSTGRDVPEATP
jgi:hypothetical protein